MFKTSLSLLVGLAAGTSVLTTTSGADPADPDRLALDAANACFIDVAESRDGIQLSAWSTSGLETAYRMVVTQRLGGGGFDIVQEGDIELPASNDAPQLLSDMELDVEAEFSAQLTTWNADGDIVCSWDAQI